MVRNRIAILISVVLLVCASIAAAQTFSDSFDDGVTTGWTVFRYGWYEADGVFHATNTAPNEPVEAVWSAGYGWTNYAAEVDVRLLSSYTPADAQLMIRYQGTIYNGVPEDNARCTLFQYGGTFLTLSVPGQPQQTYPFPYALGQWYRLRATAIGQTITCEVVGHPDTRLTATSTGATSGTVGLRGTHIPADFDNLVVTPMNASGRIVFGRGGNIWIMRTDGTDQRQLTDGGHDFNARLQNGVVTFIRAGQLYRTDTHGAPPVAIPNTSGVLEYDISLDATQLVLTYAGNNFTLWRMNVDGNGATAISNVPGWHQIYPSWSRDNAIYFGQAVFGNPFTQTLWKIDPTGANATHLTDYFTQYPRFGLASNRVVFVYNQPAPRLRTMKSDGSDQIDVPNSPSGVFASPAPDDDFDVIYYMYAGQIWRIGLDGSNNLPLTTADNDLIDYGKELDVAPLDTTPPAIVSITPSPAVLWPPNHKMVSVRLSVVVTDNVDPAPISRIVNVSSNQGPNSTGDGNTSADWEITGPLMLNLRSERSGTAERIYTITVESRDAAGNAATSTTQVRVPRDQR